MRIFRAIGLGLIIIILQFLVPALFASFEHTLLQLFHTLDIAMTQSQIVLQTGSVMPDASRLTPH